MRLVGGVDHATQKVFTQFGMARGNQPAPVGQRASAGEEAPRLRRVAHDLAQPAHHVGFQLIERGRHAGYTGIAVQGVADEVCQGRVENSAARHIPHESRRRRIETQGREVMEYRIEQLLKVTAQLRHRFLQRAEELCAGFSGPVHRLLGKRRNKGPYAVHAGSHHGAHLCFCQVEGPIFGHGVVSGMMERILNPG